MIKCYLNNEINTCPYYKKENMECKSPTPCNFAKNNAKIKNTYMRQERWYEKYYKK